MTAPIKPQGPIKPEEWFTSLVMEQIAPPPSNTPTTLEALGLANYPSQALRALRRTAGGVVEGALNVPLDVAEFVTSEGGLADTPGLLDAALDPLQSVVRSLGPGYRRKSDRIGDRIGGEWLGEPQSDPRPAGQIIGGLTQVPFPGQTRALRALLQRIALAGGADRDAQLAQALALVAREDLARRVRAIDELRARASGQIAGTLAPLPLAGTKALDQFLRRRANSARGVLASERGAVQGRRAPTFADEVAQRLEARRVAPEDRGLLDQLGGEQIDLSGYSREELIREQAKTANRIGDLEGIRGYDNPVELSHAQAYKRALDQALAAWRGGS